MKTRDDILAHHYAAELLDYVCARGFSEATVVDGEAVPEICLDGETIKIDDRFNRRLFVTQVAPDHNSEWPCLYKIVAVEVNWKTELQQRSFRMAGVIYAGRN